jgi:hypothetical protein
MIWFAATTNVEYVCSLRILFIKTCHLFPIYRSTMTAGNDYLFAAPTLPWCNDVILLAFNGTFPKETPTFEESRQGVHGWFESIGHELDLETIERVFRLTDIFFTNG